MPQAMVTAAETQTVLTGVIAHHHHSPDVRVVHDLEELAALERAWERMVPVTGASPMQEHIWCLSCAEALLDQSQLAVICILDNAGLRALAPMRKSTAFPGTYEQLGVGTLGEPSDLLYTDTSALNALLETLARFRKPLVLGRLYADAATVAAAMQVFGGKSLLRLRKCSKLPYIDLHAAGAGEVETLLSPSLLSDLRRARRKASAAGSVSFEMHRPASAAEFLPLFEEAMKVESASWKGRLGTDLDSDAPRKDFFRRYGIRAAEKGSLRLAFLRIDSEAVAMQLAVEMNNSFWLLKIGYDQTYSKCSPGLLLMLETLRFAKQQGLDSYEFLGSSEQWTQRWTRHERDSVRIEAYPFSVYGMTAAAHNLACRAWRKAIQKIKRAR